jgi:hypothetical protein
MPLESINREPWFSSGSVSWWEMEKFAAERFMAICSNLSLLAAESRKFDVALTDFAKQETCKTLHKIGQDCKAIGLRSTVIQFEEVIANIMAFTVHADQLSQIFLCLSSAIRAEMSTHLFMQILPSRIDYYEQAELFGPQVNASFTSAIRDIRSCGSCYACDRNTASVMHGMRVLEVGLSVLASHLNVSSDHANWNKIIEQIEKEIKAISGISGPARPSDWNAKMQFYSDAAKDFRYFKDAWRNHVMHFREHYEASEALTILNHIKAFMGHLADSGLKEDVLNVEIGNEKDRDRLRQV